MLLQPNVNPNPPPGQPAAAPQDGAQLHDTGNFFGNLANSAGNFIGGVASAVIHPINTVENIGALAVGAGEKVAQKIAGGTGSAGGAADKLDATLGYFKQRYGSVDNFLKTAYQDPVGVAADLSILADGVGGAVSKIGDISDVGKLGTAADVAKTGTNFVVSPEGVAAKVGEVSNPTTQVGRAISGVGEAINPINVAGKAIGAVAPLASNVLAKGVDMGQSLLKFGIGQETGFNPSTISTIMQLPDEFSKTAMATYSRGALGNDIAGGIKELSNQVSDTGKEYNDIRNTPATVDMTALSPETTAKLSEKLGFQLDTSKPIVDQIAQKYGITTDGKGNFITDENSIHMDKSELNSISDVLKQYAIDKDGNLRTTFTPKNILNLRNALDDAIPYGSKTYGVADKFAKEIRSTYDALAKEQVPNLNETDLKFKPIFDELKKAKSDFLNSDGTLKDGAASKIMSAAKAGKESLLARMESLSPGITQKIQIQAAIEDIQHAAGLKVGTYAKAATAVGGFLTMNPALIAMTIASAPGNATAILRGFGKLAGLTDGSLSSILKSNGFSDVAKTAGSAIKRVALPISRVQSATKQ